MTYIATIVLAIIGLGLLSSADSLVDYLLGAAVLVFVPLTARETYGRSRASKVESGG